MYAILHYYYAIIHNEGGYNLKNNDARLISHIRKDGRKKITRIALEEQIPVTTLYDRLKSYEKKGIANHTTLLNWKRLGFEKKAHIQINATNSERMKVEEHLLLQPFVNSLYRVGGVSEFLAECVFRTGLQMQEFLESLNELGADVTVFEELQELRRETFLTEDEHFKGVC